MSRRPKIKECADAACPATFTGRGKFCEWHRDTRADRADVDETKAKFRKIRNAEAQRRRRDLQWQARFGGDDAGGVETGSADPRSKMSSPRASLQVRGGSKRDISDTLPPSIPILREDGATWTGDPEHPTPVVFYAPAKIPDHAGVEPCVWCGWPVSIRSINRPAHSPACASYLGLTWRTPRRGGPAPIDVTGTPGMTISRAVEIFMAEWATWVGGSR